jgi:hypothetical protein
MLPLANQYVAQKRAAAKQAGQRGQLVIRDRVHGFSVTYLQEPEEMISSQGGRRTSLEQPLSLFSLQGRGEALSQIGHDVSLSTGKSPAIFSVT